MRLLMITGLGSVRDLASEKRGAFYNTLEEFHKYWERIDIIAPKIKGRTGVKNIFDNVYVHISPWPLILHPIWFLKKGLEIYKEQKFDLMTVQEFPPFYNGIGARLLWHKIRVPYVLEIHHIPGYPKAADIKEKIYRILMRLFIKFDSQKAKAVRVVNQNQTPGFLIESGVPKEKIVYIPSTYIDLDIFKPMNLPKEYDLIFVGRLEKNKGINLLLETLDILSTTYNLQPTTLIVGDGSLSDNLKLKAKSYKLQAKFFGWAKDQKEIAELLNKSKILVMPSYNEGGPRVVVEALACGVPILATSVGIVPDLLKNKPDGWTGGRGGEIIDWKVDNMAQKIRGLLNDSVRYRKYSQDGPEIAKQFEKKAAIKNYVDKLKQQARPVQVLPVRL